jgi:hypothetical protein
MRDRTIKLKSPKVSALILLANVLGCAIYLLGAQHSWVMPEEEANGIHSVTGEPFVWAAFVLPVWICFSRYKPRLGSDNRGAKALARRSHMADGTFHLGSRSDHRFCAPLTKPKPTELC